jgi:hypothetical protein
MVGHCERGLSASMTATNTAKAIAIIVYRFIKFAPTGQTAARRLQANRS